MFPIESGEGVLQCTVLYFLVCWKVVPEYQFMVNRKRQTNCTFHMPSISFIVANLVTNFIQRLKYCKSVGSANKDVAHHWMMRLFSGVFLRPMSGRYVIL